MQVILIPRVGDAFFGDLIPDEKVGKPLCRIAQGATPMTGFFQMAGDLRQQVQVENYEYKGTVIKRGGQPIIAFYEQA